MARPVLAASDHIPSSLTDKEFWQLVVAASERAGNFRSDNLVSNERRFQDVIPDLTRSAKPGGIYLGVGPEQNFTYIAALRPKMAFIIDIRRGNLALHLMYKALFELSADRAEFVSRLFCRQRPGGLTATSSVAEIFEAYDQTERNQSIYAENMQTITTHLTRTHGFALTAGDMRRLAHIASAFCSYGSALRFSSTGFGGRLDDPTYRDLMVATDPNGQPRSYLASESAFALVKQLQTDNLIVPLIGNFAGALTLRAVRNYLNERSAIVSVFYVSNVEDYLRNDGGWPKFCANLSALPFEDGSLFIRALGGDISSHGLTSEVTAVGPTLQGCNLN